MQQKQPSKSFGHLKQTNDRGFMWGKFTSVLGAGSIAKGSIANLCIIWLSKEVQFSISISISP